MKSTDRTLPVRADHDRALVKPESPLWRPALALLSLAGPSLACVGCGGDATSTTAPEGPPANEPAMSGELEQWTWVPFDDAFCANGKPTGLALNLTDRSSDVVIFLAGGGACWDYPTCYESSLATYVRDGFGETDMPALTIMTAVVGFMSRDDPTNPFRDASVVALPYCTGDTFTGSHTAVYEGRETHHVGHENVLAYLKRIVPTFPHARRVTLAGVSAGGIGSAYNWWHVQKAFGDVRVDMIDDSGALLPSPYLPDELVQKWRDVWGVDAGLPPDCADCTQHLDALIDWSVVAMPGSRGALLAYTRDTALPFFFGIPEEQFTTGLDALVDTRLTGHPNINYFIADGASHVVMPHPTLEQNGVSVRGWLTSMVTDDPAWTSVRP